MAVEKRGGSQIPVIKYVRAFLISSPFSAQLVNDFTGPLVQLVEMLSLDDAHAAPRVTPYTMQARVQISVVK